MAFTWIRTVHVVEYISVTWGEEKTSTTNYANFKHKNKGK